MKNFTPLAQACQPGDILCFKTTDSPVIDEAIRLEETEGLRVGEVNHAAIYVGNGLIVEALTAGIQRNPLSNYFLNANAIYLGRPIRASPAQLDGAVQWALVKIGTKYGFLQVVYDGTLGLIPWLKRFDFGINKTRLDCSGLCATSYFLQRYVIDPRIECYDFTPQNLLDAMRAATMLKLIMSV